MSRTSEPLLMRMLSGLTSRCTHPFSCMWVSACVTHSIIFLTAHPRGREVAAEHRLQVRSPEVLHDEVAVLFCELEFVDANDVRMVELLGDEASCFRDALCSGTARASGSSSFIANDWLDETCRTSQIWEMLPVARQLTSS